MTSFTVTVGDHTFPVQVFRTTDERDQNVPGLARETPPLPEPEWPMTPTKVQQLANDKLQGVGGQPDRLDDCIWAVETLDLGNEFFARRAKSRSERAHDHVAARSQYLRGELT